MTTLLDTTVVIDCLRQLPRAQTYFGGLDAQPSISVVTIAEILAGARNRGEEDAAARFWKLVKPLRLDHAIAELAGGYIRHFGTSHGVDLPDAFIAATAEHHGLKLATLNVKHFPMFPKLKRPY